MNSFTLPGLTAPASISIDTWGMAHIRAQNTQDAFFVQGFNAVRDRLWQIDLWRKRGLGLLAADFGPGYLMQDRAARLFLYRGDMAPIVADNLIAQMKNAAMPKAYDGYGSCPLTVEHGKIILAEFGYGGKLMPSFPWDSTKPRRAAWFLKKSVLPWIYWNTMLKGKEWLVKTTS